MATRSPALAYAELLAGGVILYAAVKGQSLQDILAGRASPIRPLTSAIPDTFESAASGSTTALTSYGGGRFKGTGKSNLNELFYDPIGWYLDGGKKVAGAIGDHTDHVHVGFDRGTYQRDPEQVLAVLGIAKQFGLTVGEGPHAGGIPSSGHAEGSLHYTGDAYDVSGSPQAMREFFFAVQDYYSKRPKTKQKNKHRGRTRQPSGRSASGRPGYLTPGGSYAAEREEYTAQGLTPPTRKQWEKAGGGWVA